MDHVTHSLSDLVLHSCLISIVIYTALSGLAMGDLGLHCRVGHVYMALAGLDLPGAADYRCRYRIASPVCTVSVLDAREAGKLCDLDPQCNAFVLSLHQRSWTGV